MKKRFHLFQLRSMQKSVESTEATLIMKLFVDDLRETFEQEKLQVKKESESDQEQEGQEPKFEKIKSDSSPTLFKHLILSNKSTNDHSLDFDLNSSSTSLNPLKRHIDPDSDDPDVYKDETSTHRTIKHHSPNFANKLLHLQTQGVKTEPACSFSASSSSSSNSSTGTSTNSSSNSNGCSDELKDNKDNNVCEAGSMGIDMTGLDDELVLNEDELGIC